MQSVKKLLSVALKPLNLERLSRAQYEARFISSYIQRTHTCGELREDHIGEDVTLCGWLQYQRMMGKFFTVRDSFGSTQVTLNDSSLEKYSSTIDSLPLESVIQVQGKVINRPDGQQNKNMDTGDIEIELTGLQILNSCRGSLPFQIREFNKAKECLRLEHRYLDIRNTEIQRNLRLRSKLIMEMRKFLCDEHGFVDVETPTLFRRTPGGAREFVVPTHQPGKFYTLPQSPQQFKQLLMVGGIDRYVQIARCYRDESAKPDRQPEFTQVDIEMSFVTQEKIKCLIEDMLVASWPEHLNPISTPFPRLPYKDAMEQYGSDKPDTRFGVKLKELTQSLRGCPLQPIARSLEQTKSSIQGINFKGAGSKLSNKDITALQSICKDLQDGLHQDVWIAIVKVKEDGRWQGSLGKNMGGSYVEITNQELDLSDGDLMVLASGPNTNVHTLVGRMRLEIANILEKKGEVIRKDGMHFLWVEDFPLFLPKEDGSPGLESAHHPFTAPHPEDEAAVFEHTTLDKIRSQHYDLVLNGNEIGGGSIRIHNAKLQRYILNDVLQEDSSTLAHLLTALESGCPPHGGIALGLDRLVAVLCGTASIRDVIAFPKSGDGKDLMSKSPAAIEEADLKYYHLNHQLKPK